MTSIAESLLNKAILNGTLVPPPTVFLKVVDILIAADGRAQYDAPREPPRHSPLRDSCEPLRGRIDP